MKGLIAVILIAVIGYFSYEHFLNPHNSAPYKAYVAFADSLDKGSFDAATQMAYADSGAGEAIRYRESWMRTYRLTVTQTFRSIDSKEIGADQARFSITQNTFTVPGMTPPAMPDFRIVQQVTLAKEGESWMIESFSEEIIRLETP